MNNHDLNEYELTVTNQLGADGKSEIVKKGTSIIINVKQTAANTIKINGISGITYDSTLFTGTDNGNGTYTFTALKDLPSLSTNIDVYFTADNPGYNWDGKNNETNPANAPVTFTATSGRNSANAEVVYVNPLAKASQGGGGTGFLIGALNKDDSMVKYFESTTPYTNAQDSFLGAGYNAIPNYFNADTAKIADGSYYQSYMLQSNNGLHNGIMQISVPGYDLDKENTRLVFRDNADKLQKVVDISHADGVKFNITDHQVTADLTNLKNYDGIVSLVTFVKFPSTINPETVKANVISYRTWIDGNGQSSSETLEHVGYFIRVKTQGIPSFNGPSTLNYNLTPGQPTATIDTSNIYAVNYDPNQPTTPYATYPFTVQPADATTAKYFPGTEFKDGQGFSGVNLVLDQNKLDFDANGNLTLKFNLTANYKDTNNQSQTVPETLVVTVHKVLTSVSVTYIDQTTNKVIKVVNVPVDNETNPINYQSSNDLKQFTSNGYVLAQNNYDANGTAPKYDGTTSAYYIYLKHGLKVTPVKDLATLVNQPLDASQTGTQVVDEVTNKTYQLTNPTISGVDFSKAGVNSAKYEYKLPSDLGSDSIDTTGKVYVDQFDVRNVILTIGDKYDPEDGVTAVDANGNKVTLADKTQLKVSGSDKVNTNAVGIFNVEYTYTNELGNQITKEAQVLVGKKATPSAPATPAKPSAPATPSAPSSVPSSAPSAPSSVPSSAPSSVPSSAPSSAPSSVPSSAPSSTPSSSDSTSSNASSANSSASNGSAASASHESESVSTQSSASDKNQFVNHSNNAKLPQTGEQDSQWAAVIGLILFILSFGLLGGYLRKKN